MTAKMPKILLVDDDDLVRDIGHRLLLSMGHVVQCASGGSEAMDILWSGARFDFLFTDVMMPGGMDGIDLAKAATQVDPDMRIILASGNVDQESIDRESLPSLFAVLSKPYRRQRLAELFGG